jgi:iron complex outermembrane receptor protein/vitamin B12 transporter
MTTCRTAARRRRTIALAALAALPVAALAQAVGSTVVITGTRLPASATGLAQSVTVIEQAEIQRMHAARIEDILGRVTGAYVDQAGATGSFTSMYMRGAENSHLLILLDGVKLNDPTTTRGSAYDLSAIDLSQIDRIEVLRGPASAVYGGEALAGVVHIITKRAAAQGVAGSGTLALGSDHHRKAGASVSFGPENVRAQVSAGTSHDGSSSDDGKLRLNSASGSVRFAPGAGLDVGAFASHAGRKSEAFPDDSGGPRLAVNRAKTLRDSTDQALGVRIGWGDAKRVRIEGHLSRFDRDEHADNAFVDSGVRFPVPPFISDTNMKRTNAQVLARHEYGSQASVVAGLEHQVEDGDLTSVGDFFGLGSPQTLSFELKRKTNAVFAEGRIQVLPAVAVQLGVRRDKVEGIESVTTPHLGAVWELPNGATTLKASYGKGFKPPSFFALGFPIGGNPDLRPERSVNSELSVSHKFDAAGSAVVQVSLFQIDYKDLVDFDGTTFTNVNRGTIVVKGIEPELRWRVVDRVRLQLGATLLNIDVRDGLQPLRNRPETRATAQVVVDIDARRSMFVGMNHTGKFLDRSNPTGDIDMPAYTVVDAGYQVQYGAFRVKLAIDNLFDKNYEQFVGFPGQGRRLRAEVRTEF